MYIEDPDDPEDAETWYDIEGDKQDNLEALIQDYDLEGDQEPADAFATIMQKKKKPHPQKGQKGQSKGYPFKAHGEISVDQKAKDARQNAVQFLKQVTPCTSCGQRGLWSGDSECPNAKKKVGKPTGATTFRKKSTAGAPKKKPAGSRYVTAGATEVQAYDETSQFFVETADGKETDFPDVPDGEASYHVEHAGPRDTHGGAIKKSAKKLFTNEHEFFSEGKAHDREEQVYMALRVPDLCSHSSYKGGNERKYHRSTNGHTRATRGIHCKEPECERAVILARRKEPAELWSFLVQVALCTLWGPKSRSRALFARVSQVRSEALEEEERERQLRPQPLEVDLPTFPELPAEDSDILIPLPGDGALCGNETPFCGSTFKTVASSKDSSVLRPSHEPRLKERAHDPRGVSTCLLPVRKVEAFESGRRADARHAGPPGEAPVKPVLNGDDKIHTSPGGHGPIAPRHRLRARLRRHDDPRRRRTGRCGHRQLHQGQSGPWWRRPVRRTPSQQPALERS